MAWEHQVVRAILNRDVIQKLSLPKKVIIFVWDDDRSTHTTALNKFINTNLWIEWMSTVNFVTRHSWMTDLCSELGGCFVTIRCNCIYPLDSMISARVFLLHSLRGRVILIDLQSAVGHLFGHLPHYSSSLTSPSFLWLDQSARMSGHADAMEMLARLWLVEICKFQLSQPMRSLLTTVWDDQYRPFAISSQVAKILLIQ